MTQIGQGELAIMIGDEAEAVMAAVIYADGFNYALSDDQVERWAVGIKVTKDRLRLIRHPDLGRQDGFWSLQGREDLIGRRDRDEVVRQAKLAIARKWIWTMAWWPWVELVGVTGSVAGGNPKEDDDIDLLVVCRPHRLWISRLLITVVLSGMRKRRRPDSDQNRVKDLLCLNMWLDSNHMTEPVHSLYVANELARVVPLLTREGAYERYMAANRWAGDYLPGMFTADNSQQAAAQVVIDGDKGADRGWRWVDRVDEWCERLLRWRMRRPTTEVVESGRLQFQPLDYAGQIEDRFRQAWRTWKA